MPRRVEEVTRELVDGVSVLEMRELCLDLMRDWRRKRPAQRDFHTGSDLAVHLIALLSQQRTHVSLDGHEINGLKEYVWSESYPFVEFTWFLVRSGIAVPLGAPAGMVLLNLQLTDTGLRFLDSDAADHPLLPRFVERIVQRCTGLPANVASLLVDAKACLDNGLLRPAVITMGVAYEVAVEAVVDSLVTRGVLQPQPDVSAAVRIRNIRNQIDNVLPAATVQERDDRFATHRAYDFADALRRRRNEVAHNRPRYGLDDREETEELLLGAGRHLPRLWAMH